MKLLIIFLLVFSLLTPCLAVRVVNLDANNAKTAGVDESYLYWDDVTEDLMVNSNVSDMTIIYICKINGIPSSSSYWDGCAVSRGSGNPSVSMYFRAEQLQANSKVLMRVGNGSVHDFSDDTSSLTDVFDDEWHIFVIAFDYIGATSSKARFFIDGKFILEDSVATSTYFDSSSAVDGRIGRYWSQEMSFYACMQGQMSDSAITAFSASGNISELLCQNELCIYTTFDLDKTTLSDTDTLQSSYLSSMISGETITQPTANIGSSASMSIKEGKSTITFKKKSRR